ncbi:MAG: hypothetical protein LN589_03840 [Rickettsia endosymbiont of Eriopis connexa]|nr:hypothetical protein [Rickettsia endosymbiont of Eriopis connexa]
MLQCYSRVGIVAWIGKATGGHRGEIDPRRNDIKKVRDAKNHYATISL